MIGCQEPIDSDHTDGPQISGCVVGPAPSLTVGKGEYEWVGSEADEGHTELVHGMQGGFHTFVSLRAAHLSLDGEWAVSLSGTLDGEELAFAELTRTPECAVGADLGESIGTWLIWRSRPPQLHDQTVTIEATVTDIDGRQVTATGTQVIWDETQLEE